MINYFNGDVTTSSANIIAHCVNCQGVMGSGVAKTIKQKWPDVFRTYEAKCKLTYNPNLLFGLCQIIQIEKKKGIANLFGQEYYGKEKRHLNYEYLYLALEDLAKQMKSLKLESVAFPDMIGCGLAGGEREIIYSMIQTIFKDFKVELWKYEPISTQN